MAYAPRETEDIFDPFTAYLQRLGLGQRNYLNPAEQYQVGQYNPLSTMYGVQGRMATQFPELLPGYFTDYALGNPNRTGGNIYGYANSLMSKILGATPEARGTMGTVWEPTWSEGERTSGGNIAELQQLLQTALRQNLGRPGANWLAGNLPAEQQRWAGGLAQGGTGTFLDYIRQKYNLQGLGL